jgi:lysophospholipase L1-like esterase
MGEMRCVGLAAIAALALFCRCEPAQAEAALHCGHFTQDQMPAPEPREAAAVRKRFEQINAAVKTEPYRVLFFGDSLTERFETWDAPQIWREHMVPRGVLGAGVNGDRTEHLLWRLDNGNLAGPPPQGVVLWIGTNDLGHDRSVEDTAEGIRADLSRLREKLPAARVLLLGLTPRGAAPDAKFRAPIRDVNNLIQTCADGTSVTFADIGGVLLDPEGRLIPAISPDRLHFSRLGYERLVPKLDPLIDGLLSR